MVYNFSYEITATVFASLLLAYLMFQKELNIVNKRFRRLVCMTVLCALTDMLTAILFMNYDKVPVWVNSVANFLYYASAYALVYFFRTYIDAFLLNTDHERLKKVERIADVICAGAFFILLVMNVPFGFIYYFDANGIYAHGSAYILIFIPIVFHIILVTVITVVYRKCFSMKQIVSTIAFIVIFLGAMAVQIYLLPEVLLTLTAAIVAIFFVYFALESPDHYKMVQTAKELKETTEKLNELKDSLEMEVKQQTKEIQDKSDKLQTLSVEIAESLASTIDARDKYTIGHSLRVATYSRLIAKKMGKPEDYLDLIYEAGLLHDIGKIGIADAILNKPGKLSQEEFHIMASHSAKGTDILKSVLTYPEFALVAGGHHERYDGKGYPNGLKGEEIFEMARIVSVADAFDAMTSDRSYRSALPLDIARRELVNGKGTQFDPIFVDCFVSMLDKSISKSLDYKSTINDLLRGEDELFVDMTIESKTNKIEVNL